MQRLFAILTATAFLVLIVPTLFSRLWQNMAGLYFLEKPNLMISEAGRQSSPATKTLLHWAVIFDAENTRAWRQLGYTFLQEGHVEDALTAWKNAGGLDQEFTRWEDIALRQEDSAEALVWQQLFWKLAPASAEAWYNLGRLHERHDNWVLALAAFEEALNQNDSQQFAGSLNYHRGWLYHRRMESPDIDLALEFYNTALASDNFIEEWELIETHYQRGAILRQLGQLQEAQASILFVIQKNPDHYRANALYGLLVWQLDGDFDLAERYLNKAVNINPDLVLAHESLAKIYVETGDSASAQKSYKRVLEIDPDHKGALRFLTENELDYYNPAR